MSIVRSIIVGSALALLLPSTAGLETDVNAAQHGEHITKSRSELVNKVREATDAYRDVRNVPSGYDPVLGCVTGPLEGAMGVHYVNGGLLMNDELLVDQPEALIYEFKGGEARLVGVEYIVLASVWHQKHAVNDPPVFEGQLLNFEDSPNRFGLPAFYELHVWAWRDNPNGVFVDWNPSVSCENP